MLELWTNEHGQSRRPVTIIVARCTQDGHSWSPHWRTGNGPLRSCRRLAPSHDPEDRRIKSIISAAPWISLDSLAIEIREMNCWEILTRANSRGISQKWRTNTSSINFYFTILVNASNDRLLSQYFQSLDSKSYLK